MRLAIISESASAGIAAHLLTAEFSPKPEVQLLERNDADKLYQEQALAAAGPGVLKLGKTLGADGLLLLRSPSRMR